MPTIGTYSIGSGGIVLKRRLFFLCVLALALSAPVPAAAETALSDYVRLHVIAADDTEAAQALKLEVRDACLACARALLADCGDADAAWTAVNENLDALADAAEARARALGYEGTVRCETGVFAFPDRDYGAVRVPAGEYRALRVIVGAGEGRNWWCVLYPSLCFPDELPAEEPVVFYSSIWNWLKGLFGA